MPSIKSTSKLTTSFRDSEWKRIKFTLDPHRLNTHSRGFSKKSFELCTLNNNLVGFRNGKVNIKKKRSKCYTS